MIWINFCLKLGTFVHCLFFYKESCWRLYENILKLDYGDGFTLYTFKPYDFPAAKSLQSYPTLCNPVDGSPSGSPVPGILQARTLEWVAISFSNA